MGLLLHCSNRFHALFFLCFFLGLFFFVTFFSLKDHIHVLHNFQDLTLYVVSKAHFSPSMRTRFVLLRNQQTEEGRYFHPFQEQELHKYILQQLRYNALFTNSKCTHFYTDLTIDTQFLFPFCLITSINKLLIHISAADLTIQQVQNCYCLSSKQNQQFQRQTKLLELQDLINHMAEVS